MVRGVLVNLLAKQLFGRLARRVMIHRSMIYLSTSPFAVKRSSTSFFEAGFHTRGLAASKTLEDKSPWKRPRRVIARSADKISNEIRFLTSLVGKGTPHASH